MCTLFSFQWHCSALSRQTTLARSLLEKPSKMSIPGSPSSDKDIMCFDTFGEDGQQCEPSHASCEVHAFSWCICQGPSFTQEIWYYIGVSKNNGTPKSSILIGFSSINHPFWGNPIFGNTHMYFHHHLRDPHLPFSIEKETHFHLYPAKWLHQWNTWPWSPWKRTNGTWTKRQTSTMPSCLNSICQVSFSCVSNRVMWTLYNKQPTSQKKNRWWHQDKNI